MKPELKELYDKPCECVSCGTCNGSGKEWHYDTVSCCDEPELCVDCGGGGITEECDRCMEIEELEREDMP